MMNVLAHEFPINYDSQLQSYERTVWGNVTTTAPTTGLQMLLLGTLINVYIMNFERIMTYPFWLGACAVSKHIHTANYTAINKLATMEGLTEIGLLR